MQSWREGSGYSPNSPQFSLTGVVLSTQGAHGRKIQIRPTNRIKRKMLHCESFRERVLFSLKNGMEASGMRQPWHWAWRDEEGFKRRERDGGRTLGPLGRKAVWQACGDLLGMANIWGPMGCGKQVSRRSTSAGLQPSVQSPQKGSRWGLVWRPALESISGWMYP